MKIRIASVACVAIAACPLLALPRPAQAQGPSSLQLYGRVGAGVVDTNHQAGGGSLRAVNDNVLMTSFMGLRGGEDLGGGLRTNFQLETQLAPDTGASGSPTLGFWNRQSWVGLDLGPHASVTLGRQFHTTVDLLVQSLMVYNLAGADGEFTPLALVGVNRYSSNDTRVSNAIKVRLRGPAGTAAAYSFGAGEGTAGNSYSATLSQVTKAYSVGAYFMQYNATPAAAQALGHLPKQQVAGGGLQWPIGPLRLYLTYLHNTLDGTTAGKGTQRNRIGILGIAYRLAPSVMLKAEYTADRGTTLDGVQGRDGRKNTINASAQWWLSRRTNLYLAFADNRYTGGYVAETLNIAAFARAPGATSIQQWSSGFEMAF
ncbi:MAG: porin [Burkholderiales bacterium]|nr:porin [Burkholderiales bacterium]